MWQTCAINDPDVSYVASRIWLLFKWVDVGSMNDEKKSDLGTWIAHILKRSSQKEIHIPMSVARQPSSRQTSRHLAATSGINRLCWLFHLICFDFVVLLDVFGILRNPCFSCMIFQGQGQVAFVRHGGGSGHISSIVFVFYYYQVKEVAWCQLNIIPIYFALFHDIGLKNMVPTFKQSDIPKFGFEFFYLALCATSKPWLWSVPWLSGCSTRSFRWALAADHGPSTLQCWWKEATCWKKKLLFFSPLSGTVTFGMTYLATKLVQTLDGETPRGHLRFWGRRSSQMSKSRSFNRLCRQWRKSRSKSNNVVSNNKCVYVYIYIFT